MLSRRNAWLVLSVACVFVTGCGEGSGQPAEKSESEIQRPGSPSSLPQEQDPVAQATQERGKEGPPKKQQDDAVTVESPAKTTEPASVRQATALIDLREFPLMPDAADAHSKAALVVYQAPSDVPSAVEYHVKHLAELGWKEDTEGTPRRVDEQSAYLGFLREGFFLFLSIDALADQEGWVRITLGNQGNVDTSLLPKADDATVLLGGQATSVYETPADPESVVAFTRKAFTSLGWQEYKPRFEPVDASADAVSLRFKQNGISLSAHITTAPDGEGKTTVQYDTSVLSYDFPVMPDAAEVQYDDDLPHLRFTVPADFEEVADFFRRQAESLGWTAQEDRTDVDDDSRRLFFEDAESNLFMLQMTKTEEETTQVTLERVLTQPAEEPPAPTSEPESSEPPDARDP